MMSEEGQDYVGDEKNEGDDEEVKQRRKRSWKISHKIIAREKAESFGGISTERRNHGRPKRGRGEKGLVTRAVMMHTLAQRRSAPMIEEDASKLLEEVVC